MKSSDMVYIRTYIAGLVICDLLLFGGNSTKSINNFDNIDDFGKITNKVDDVVQSGKNYEYSKSVLDKMDDLYHDFPKLLDDDILNNPMINRIDGRTEYLLKGTINNTDGVYHITIKSNQIIHIVFVPAKDWARFSNVNNLPALNLIP